MEVEGNDYFQDVADKISVVKKALTEHNREWLSATAVVNLAGDATQNGYNGSGKATTDNYNIPVCFHAFITQDVK